MYHSEMPILSLRNMASALALTATFSVAIRPALGQVPAASTKRTCSIRNAPMSPAEIAFAQAETTKDLGRAIELFTSESAAPGPDQDRAHDGRIRTLIAADKLHDAEADAKAWAASAPNNPWSTLATAQVAFRNADMGAASLALIAALKADPCNARIRADQARLQALLSEYTAAKRNLDLAHALEPNNDDITDHWLPFQPRAARIDALTAYLARATYLKPDARQRLEETRNHLLAVADSPCRLVTPLTSTTIPYRALQDGPHEPVTWGLDVLFNGKSRRMEIDTGASGITLTKSAAAALNLDPDEHLKMGGFGDQGAVDSFTAKVKSIRIGGLEFQNCDIYVLTKSPEFPGDGLIGADVFADFLVTLDFPGRLLKVDPLPKSPANPDASTNVTLAASIGSSDEPPHDRYIDPTMANWTQVFRDQHDLILPGSLNDGPNHFFILDTGADADVVSPQAAHEVGRVVAGGSYGMAGISGKVNKVYSTDPITIHFAGLSKYSLGMACIETTANSLSSGFEISGFIGAPTLQQLTLHIDYRDNLIRFDYDPKRVVHCVEGMNIPGCV